MEVTVEVIVERQCGLDVHKAQVTACVRVPGPGGERVEHIEQFATTVPGLLVLADWLAAHRVTHVVMRPPATTARVQGVVATPPCGGEP